MKKIILSIFSGLVILNVNAQSVIITEDITLFWMAYDSVKNIKDEKIQIETFKGMYNDIGSEGLKSFMKEKNFSAIKQVNLINKYPKFWASIRQRTFIIDAKKPEFEKAILKLKKIYPDLKESKMYFCIGGLNSGGTTQKDKVLIGAEIATGNKNVDCSEFSNNWLKNTFDSFDDNSIVGLNIHEYIHTQQSLDYESKFSLLGNCIAEGAADFIANLVTKNHFPHYISYYKNNESKIWNEFQFQKHGNSKSQWISTGANPNIPMDDLGYAVGYTICEYYYRNAKNKNQAIKDIITLNYNDVKATDNFLEKSKYEIYLKSKGFVPKKGEIEGYIDDESTITFLIDLKDKVTASSDEGLRILSDEEKKNIKSISVAGDFNKWDPKSANFQLKKLNDTQYELKMGKWQLGEKGETKYFKFVIDNEHWVEPRFTSPNKGSLNDSNTNLTIKL